MLKYRCSAPANEVQRGCREVTDSWRTPSRVGDISGMATIVLVLLLGWLACTALLTIGVGTGDSEGKATHRDP